MVLHLGITAVLVWLSAILLLPARTFDTSVSYALLDALAPEWAWSLVLGAGAGLGLWGLVTPRPFVRHLSCTALSLLHTLIALCMVSANPVSTASGTYIILAFLALGRLVAGR